MPNHVTDRLTITDRALAERNRLCIELKGYDPEADEEG